MIETSIQQIVQHDALKVKVAIPEPEPFVELDINNSSDEVQETPD